MTARIFTQFFLDPEVILNSQYDIIELMTHECIIDTVCHGQ